MENYIETKLVKAAPMKLGQYNEYRGWKCPADENPDSDGFLIEETIKGNVNHRLHAGHITWTPKDVFERAYKKTSSMTFGNAIEAMKAGKKVARSGWNGKGMHLYFVDKFTKEFNNHPTIIYDPFIMMQTVSGSYVPWLASQTDLLSEDWMIIA